MGDILFIGNITDQIAHIKHKNSGTTINNGVNKSLLGNFPILLFIVDKKRNNKMWQTQPKRIIGKSILQKQIDKTNQNEI